MINVRINVRNDKGAILILLRPEMKSTFHHTLIALAIVDILFLLTLIIDSQVTLIIHSQVTSQNSKPRIKFKIPCTEILNLNPCCFRYPSSSGAYADKISTLQISQNLDLDLRNQTFIFLFPYVWNPFKNILMTFETFLMMSITTERYLATRSPLQYRVGQVLLFI